MSRLMIPLEEAVKLLPDGNSIHTFRNPGPAILVGADWSRAEILKALQRADEIHVTGEGAQGMGHGLWIATGGGLFIEAAQYTAPQEPAP